MQVYYAESFEGCMSELLHDCTVRYEETVNNTIDAFESTVMELGGKACKEILVKNIIFRHFTKNRLRILYTIEDRSMIVAHFIVHERRDISKLLDRFLSA